jgi:hypothetical protein
VYEETEVMAVMMVALARMEISERWVTKATASSWELTESKEREVY